MEEFELKQKFEELLNSPDPTHGLLHRGIQTAAEWFNKISEEEKNKLVQYLILECSSISIQKRELLALFAVTVTHNSLYPLILEIEKHASQNGLEAEITLEKCSEYKRKIKGNDESSRQNKGAPADN